MHLDCVFSILGDDCCLMLDEMMGEDSPTRRLVDEWTRTPDGGYELSRQGVEFSAYMRKEGYYIIPIKAADQLVRANLLGSCTVPQMQSILIHLSTYYPDAIILWRCGRVDAAAAVLGL
jgi:N-dimethylarginine dimethylaminohydrolase